MNAERQLQNLDAPAAMALDEAGARNLDDVEKAGLDHLATLHGVGPKAIRVLKAALEE
jgi:predicted flap endonuclease-1-like 5' DNA nuclease